MSHSHGCGSSCAHEHHSHGGDHHGHDHDDDKLEGQGEQDSLFRFIDNTKVRCLNEKRAGSGASIIKPWHDRRKCDTFVESDADEQLIFYIPFTEAVKIRGIVVYSGEGESAPKDLKAFINRDDIDFDNCNDVPATQSFPLTHDADFEVDYPTKIAKFQSVSSITLFFESNFGADETKIFFLGFKGEGTGVKRGPVIAQYEARPMISDHKTKGDAFSVYKTLQ